MVAVAIVESFKKESMYGLSAGTKSGGCREVAVSYWRFDCTWQGY